MELFKTVPVFHSYLFIFANTEVYVKYRASHIILDYLQSLTPKYAHYTKKI